MVNESVSTTTTSTIAAAMVAVKTKKCYDLDEDFAIYSPASDSDDDDDDDNVNATEEAVETRLDLCASIFAPLSEWEKDDYIEGLVWNYKDSTDVTTVHISGQQLHTVLSTEQIVRIMKSLSQLPNITEFFCFHGGCAALTGDLLAQSLPPKLHILILWHFPTLSTNTFAAALRLQSSLQRLTLNFACRNSTLKPQKQKDALTWGCLDVIVMACACMERLQVLQIRCVPRSSDHHIASKVVPQQDALVSPEAFVILLNSPTIKQLYLENCGLIDDHMDEIFNELPKNQVLTMLDVKGNLFSDDCLYTTGRLLPIAPHQLQYLDISGVSITDAAGDAVAMGMVQNHTLQSLEIEGTIQRFQDEFDIPVGHSDTAWMQSILHQLRLNRAYQMAYDVSASSKKTSAGSGVTFPEKQTMVQTDITSFVAAISSVSDNASCLYHFLRTYPDHCHRLTVPRPHVEPVDEEERKNKTHH